MNSGTVLNGIKVTAVSFGLKPLIEFQSAFFNSITDLSSEGYRGYLTWKTQKPPNKGTGGHDALFGFLVSVDFC